MTKKTDLSMFDSINQANPKLSWEKRLSFIKEIFPSIEKLDWSGVFRSDPALMGDIINDIVKQSAASPKRPGKRSAVDPKITQNHLADLMGENYSVDPFPETFRKLSEGRSVRHLASKTGLERNQINRLMRGIVYPNSYVMETIAKAFGKKPEYFLEYRINYIASLIVKKMEAVPESSIVFYRKIRKIGKYGS